MTNGPENFPKIIGIAGGSGSGKTTLAQKVHQALGAQRCAIISQDNYYIDVRKLCPDGGLPDFDDPSTLEWTLLAKHLKALKGGQAVQIPTYDFTRHYRLKATQSVSPKSVIVVEGILILCRPEIRSCLDHSVFIDCPRELRLERRFHRDVTERGRTEQSIFEQFYENVDPSQTRWVDPSARHADRFLSQDEYLSGGDDLVAELIDVWS